MTKFQFPKEFTKHFFQIITDYRFDEINNMKLNNPYYKPSILIENFQLSMYGIQFETLNDSDDNFVVSFSCDDDLDLEYFFSAIATFPHKVFFKGIVIFQPSRGSANGVYEYPLDKLLSISSDIYPNMKIFKIEPYGYDFRKGDCGLPIISGNFHFSIDDNGIPSLILDKMPNLEHLVLPNPPNDFFFQRVFHPLKRLDIQNYAIQDELFLINLAKSTCFPELEFLRFTQSPNDESWFREFNGDSVTFAEYKDFMENAIFPKLKELELRGTSLSKEEIQELRLTKMGKQLEKFTCAKYQFPKSEENDFKQINIETGEILKEYW